MVVPPQEPDRAPSNIATPPPVSSKGNLPLQFQALSKNSYFFFSFLFFLLYSNNLFLTLIPNFHFRCVETEASSPPAWRHQRSRPGLWSRAPTALPPVPASGVHRWGDGGEAERTWPENQCDWKGSASVTWTHSGGTAHQRQDWRAKEKQRGAGISCNCLRRFYYQIVY